MSRVDDSDNQRIKEMQDAQLRKKVDDEKRDQASRVTKSFNQVMTDKTGKQVAKQAAHGKTAAEEAQKQGRSVLDQIRSQENGAKQPAELARRAALARSNNTALAQKRTVDTQESQVAAHERIEDMASKRQDDADRIDVERDREEDLEAKRSEEQATEHKMDHAGEGRIDPDGERRQKQKREDGEQRDERASEIEAAEGPRAAHKPQLPPDLIQKIVAKLFQAVSSDGRTSLQMDLKGDGLEGVILKIASENGRVSCTFEGCSPELKTALRNGKPALTRALATKNLKLVNLRIS